MEFCSKKMHVNTLERKLFIMKSVVLNFHNILILNLVCQYSMERKLLIVYFRNTHLIGYMSIHSREKPFHCEICGTNSYIKSIIGVLIVGVVVKQVYIPKGKAFTKNHFFCAYIYILKIITNHIYL